MRLAAISAPQWAARFQKGDYHMVIAPWLRQVAGYAQYYATAERPEETYVILDNGAGTNETQQVMAKELGDTTALIGANEVVLPDALDDAKETLLRSWKAAQYLANETDTEKVMFVPQGTSPDEWLRCRDAWLVKWHNEGMTMALSLGITGSGRAPWNALTFQRIVDTTCSVFRGVDVHLLGVVDIQRFIWDELPVSHRVGVRGVDTSVPFALGAEGKLLTPTSQKVPLKHYGQYASLPQRVMPLIDLNIRIMREWCKDGRAYETIPIELIRQVAAQWSDDVRVYTSPQFALRTCHVPPGRYALLHEGKGPLKVRQLLPGENITDVELLTEVAYGH